MIIEITKIPNIPVLDKVKDKIQKIIGLRIQVSSPNWKSAINTTSRTSLKKNAEDVKIFHIWPNNLLNAAQEKDKELHQNLLDIVNTEHLNDKRSERYFVFDFCL